MAALGQERLELVEEDVSTRLADVEQGQLGRSAGRQPPRRERPTGSGGLVRRVENRQRHGSTLLVTGSDPISPATQPP